jgi:uncharacterized RDD family membrane protein YckC
MSAGSLAAIEDALAGDASAHDVLDIADDLIDEATRRADTTTLTALADRLDAVAAERDGEWRGLAIAAMRARPVATPSDAVRVAPVRETSEPGAECPACGHPITDDESRVCSSCGLALAPSPEQRSESIAAIDEAVNAFEAGDLRRASDILDEELDRAEETADEITLIYLLEVVRQMIAHLDEGTFGDLEDLVADTAEALHGVQEGALPLTLESAREAFARGDRVQAAELLDRELSVHPVADEERARLAVWRVYGVAGDMATGLAEGDASPFEEAKRSAERRLRPAPENATAEVQATPKATTPPVSRDEAVAVAYGGFWLRTGAFLSDWLLLGMGFGLLDFAIAGVASGDGAGWLWTALVIGLTLAYFAGMHATAGGATIGEMVCKVAVRRRDGSRVDLVQAVARAITTALLWVTVVLGLIDAIMLGTDRKKRSLHDRIAGTTVVRTRGARRSVGQIASRHP